MGIPKDRQKGNPQGYLFSSDGGNGGPWPVISEEIKCWAVVLRCSRSEASLIFPKCVLCMSAPNLFRYVCVLLAVPLVTGTNFLFLGGNFVWRFALLRAARPPRREGKCFGRAIEFCALVAEPSYLGRKFLFDVLTKGAWEPERKGTCV